jgi:hypothetical protein
MIVTVTSLARSGAADQAVPGTERIRTSALLLARAGTRPRVRSLLQRGTLQPTESAERNTSSLAGAGQPLTQPGWTATPLGGLLGHKAHELAGVLGSFRAPGSGAGQRLSPAGERGGTGLVDFTGAARAGRFYLHDP